MIKPDIEISFLEPSQDDASIALGVALSVSPYRLYQIYLKAVSLFPASGLPSLPAERVKDDWDFLALSNTDIQYWLRETQSEWLISALRYLNNPAIEERIISNMSPMAGGMLRDDVHADFKCEIDGETAKIKLWEILDQLQKDEYIFNWQGELISRDEAGNYLINFGAASITLSSDEVISLMRQHYPKMLELSEHGA